MTNINEIDQVDVLELRLRYARFVNNKQFISSDFQFRKYEITKILRDNKF